MSYKGERRSELGGEQVRDLTEKAKSEQRKKKHTRDRSYDSNERLPRVTYEFPQELIDRVKEIAAEIEEDISARVAVYQVARLLIETGIEQYEAGELDFQTYPKEVSLFPE